MPISIKSYFYSIVFIISTVWLFWWLAQMDASRIFVDGTLSWMPIFANFVISMLLGAFITWFIAAIVDMFDWGKGSSDGY